ncbi:hypothetical protein JCM19294_2289 [Nonlabens tegetincola]|uniref:Uncharacterized protein n=1 Tax=Nonlabens tegetincola TaxID=323273 RepID=A0A090Q028_9FLAO|nr:hypothetical protein JCM19294_2289 [Nonlabens tegetincola]
MIEIKYLKKELCFDEADYKTYPFFIRINYLLYEELKIHSSV